MVETETHIEVVIDVNEPIELGDFVSSFTAIANQYQRHMKLAHPDLKDDAQVFVREIRSGSIIADLVPGIANIITAIDQTLIVEQFVQLYANRLSQYFDLGGRAKDVSKNELNDFSGQIAAIARSKNGSGTISAVTYEDGNRQVKATIKFNADTAIRATKEIENHRTELDAISSADRERVLMTFKRSDISNTAIGVRSGERVIIEEISDKDLALIYGSPLSEERIKDQMRNTEENIYHKGFVVDVNVTMRGGRAVAYAVTHVHQIIDLVDE
jgi:hypothetical protein